MSSPAARPASRLADSASRPARERISARLAVIWGSLGRSLAGCRRRRGRVLRLELFPGFLVEQGQRLVVALRLDERVGLLVHRLEPHPFVGRGEQGAQDLPHLVPLLAVEVDLGRLEARLLGLLGFAVLVERGGEVGEQARRVVAPPGALHHPRQGQGDPRVLRVGVVQLAEGGERLVGAPLGGEDQPAQQGDRLRALLAAHLRVLVGGRDGGERLQGLVEVAVLVERPGDLAAQAGIVAHLVGSLAQRLERRFRVAVAGFEVGQGEARLERAGIEAEDVGERPARLVGLVGAQQRLDQQGVGHPLLGDVVDQLAEHLGRLGGLVLVEIDPPQGEEGLGVARIALAHRLEGIAGGGHRAGVRGGEIDVDLADGAQHVEVVGRQAAGLGDLLRRLAQRIVAQRGAPRVLRHAVEELRVLDQHVRGLPGAGRQLLGLFEGGERVVDRALDGQQLAEGELERGPGSGGRGGRGGHRSGRGGGRRGRNAQEGGEERQAGGANR